VTEKKRNKGGAPFGNKNNLGGKDRDFKNALLRTVKQYEDKGVPRGEALNRVTERLVKFALHGDPKEALPAMHLIADRIEGKAAQALHGEPGMPELITLKWEDVEEDDTQ
jgi:hypothetical protein